MNTKTLTEPLKGSPNGKTASLVDPLRSTEVGKIQPNHLERLAIVYVRQSSPQQVHDHQKSTARQYALVDRAVQLGWSRDRVLVIDEDQGLSGQTAEGRDGFQRVLLTTAQPMQQISQLQG